MLLALFGKETLTMIIDRGNPICKSFLYESKTYRFICLPILLVSEKILIHEINHALTTFFLTKNMAKIGINVYDEEDVIDELLNERVSREVYEIFKKRGGDFSKIKLVTFKDFYTKNLYLIDEFYNKFKDIIKETLITLNKNNLVERVGKKNYEELVKMVNKYYVKDKYLPKKNKKESKSDRKKIVKKMRKRVVSIEELTKEDLKKFYKQLKEEGKSVRILNELREEKEENNSLHF